MPDCPHCHEYYFGNPDQCPKCFYDFKLKRVISQKELRELQLQRQQEREQLRKQDELNRHKEEEINRQHELQAKEHRIQALEHNALYEYTTVYLAESRSGILDKTSLDTALAQHAAQGWKLHSILTNEAGKNASSVGFGGIAVGTNATMDVTILIFERCVKLAGQ